MQVAEASVVVPLSPEETWDLVFGDPQRAVELVPDIVAIEGFQIRDDGTPRYRMVRRFCPFTMSFVSDYSVFERPYRTVSRALESPLGGTFYTIHEPPAGGTRAHWRWELESKNPLVGRLLPVLRPLLAWSLRRDLNAAAKAVETEALGQTEIARLLTERLDRELREPLAAVLEREERQRVLVRERLAREGPS